MRLIIVIRDWSACSLFWKHLMENSRLFVISAFHWFQLLLRLRLSDSCRSSEAAHGHRLQSVQNAAARLIFRARRYDHVQPLLRSLHWLRVPERIAFRLAVLVYRCLHDSAPGYLAWDLQCVWPRRTSAAALVVYVSARCPTHRACYHRRPSLPGGCCICLEQFALDSTFIAVFRRRLKTELLSGLTAVLPHERLTVLTTMWPHIIVTCRCSPRTLCHVKSILYHHHHHHHHCVTV